MTTYKLLRTHKLMKAPHKFQCWIILVQFLITNGLNIFRGDLGDIKYDNDDGQPCPNGTFLIHQDETLSISCIITMDEGGEFYSENRPYLFWFIGHNPVVGNGEHSDKNERNLFKGILNFVNQLSKVMTKK